MAKKKKSKMGFCVDIAFTDKFNGRDTIVSSVPVNLVKVFKSRASGKIIQGKKRRCKIFS